MNYDTTRVTAGSIVFLAGRVKSVIGDFRTQELLRSPELVCATGID